MNNESTEWWERALQVFVWFGKWFLYFALAWAVLLLVSNLITENNEWGLMFNSVALGAVVYFLTLLTKRVVKYVVKGD